MSYLLELRAIRASLPAGAEFDRQREALAAFEAITPAYRSLDAIAESLRVMSTLIADTTNPPTQQETAALFLALSRAANAVRIELAELV